MIADGAVHAGHVERFRAIIAARVGLDFAEEKSGFLADVLRRRMAASAQRTEAYLSRLEAPSGREELPALAQELTISETYFFRDVGQFRALNDIVIPDLLAAQAGSRRLRILSLGCASGEEAYSLAIVVRDALGTSSCALSIVGVDLSAAMIENARRGRFSAWSLRQTPESDRQRWFRRDGRDFVLDERLRAQVRFEPGNIADDDGRLWQNGSWDVVFCRNVLMYFAHVQVQAVIRRIAVALRPGGYLFLGHAETLRNVSTDFHVRHSHGTFYYCRKDAIGDVAGHPVPRTDTRPLQSAPSPDAAAAAHGAWIGVIHRASERVTALTGPSRGIRATGSETVSTAPVWDAGVVLDLLRQERYTEALSIIDGLPRASQGDAGVQLLRGMLLAHAGQLAQAKAVCARLLDRDELHAGARYVLGLCSDASGDHVAACSQHEMAAYLDPSFAMPRVQLGLLARRSGDASRARREFGQALVLLQQEDAARLLLFGGGFRREALIALCRTEFVRCGGRP